MPRGAIFLNLLGASRCWCIGASAIQSIVAERTQAVQANHAWRERRAVDHSAQILQRHVGKNLRMDFCVQKRFNFGLRD